MDGDKEDETQIGIRMSLKTRELIEKAAAKDNRKASTWMRLRAVSQARAEIGGAAPPVEPDDEEAATLAALRQLEALDPALPIALLRLGDAARSRPPLARALRELADAVAGDAPAETGAPRRRGQRKG